jgi:hypothetical protein
VTVKIRPRMLMDKRWTWYGLPGLMLQPRGNVTAAI